MSRIETLRRQLVTLNWRQSLNAQGASTFLVFTILLCTMLALFAIDFFFEPPKLQRLVAIAAAAAVALRLIWKRGPSLSGDTQSATQTALKLTEQPPDDLVAALQFASPSDASSGSADLKQALIQQVESAPINVFAGFRWTSLLNSFATFAVLAAAIWGAAAVFPIHAAVFIDRLAMGERIYPKSTEIRSVAVNQQPVLMRTAGQSAQPGPARCPQGKPLVVQVRTTGTWPETGALQLTSLRTGADRVIEFQRRTKAERLATLRQTLADVRRVRSDAPDLADAARRSVAAAAIDLPQADVDGLLKEHNWAAIEEAVAARVKELGSAPADAIWHCEMPRLVEPATYRVSIGDCRTAPGQLEVAEIPVVELNTNVNSPEYAGDAVPSPAPTARQFTVLEGSSVAMTVRSLTKQPLGKAWISLWAEEDDPVVIELQPSDGKQMDWTTGDAAPLMQITKDLRYEVMAEDEAGYSIENPLRGVIRVRADRLPTGKIQSVHRVVLPSASPVIRFLANDDFGVAKVVLRAQVERQADDIQPVAPGVSAGEQGEAAEAADESKSYVVVDRLAVNSQLPVQGEYTLQLSPLGVEKGDRLKVTADVLDGRGELDGKWASSESIYLEISDESGVLNAIAEPDERSEQRLDDLIRRQLGIGDEP